MAPAENLLVAAFDPKKLAYVVPGHPDMIFPGEDAARRAGCIVMPQGPQAGDVRCLSSTELTLQAQLPAGPLVVSGIPGTIRQPPRPRPAAAAPSKPSGPGSQPTMAPARRRAKGRS